MSWSLAPFKFKFQQFRLHYNVVADALLELFGDVSENNTQVSCGVSVHLLPLLYSCLAEHQAKDDYGADIQRVFQACVYKFSVMIVIANCASELTLKLLKNCVPFPKPCYRQYGEVIN